MQYPKLAKTNVIPGKKALPGMARTFFCAF